MSGEKSVRETLEELKVLSTPEEPYTGEIRDPENDLDRMVLGALATYGVDPEPVRDPYAPAGTGHVRAINPNAIAKDEYYRYMFGANYLTKHFDISDETRLIVAYNMKQRIALPGMPEVVIDNLKPEGGLESRIKFSSSSDSDKESTIFKSRVTEFNPHHSQRFDLFSHWQQEHEDFTVELGHSLTKVLELLLKEPDGSDAVAFARGLSEVSSDEEELTEKNRSEAEKERTKFLEMVEKNRGGGFIPTDSTSKIGGFTPTRPSPRRA